MARPSFDEMLLLAGAWPKRRRQAAVAGLLAVLAGAYTYFWALGDVQALDALDGQLAAIKEQRAEKERFTNDFARYEAELAANHALLKQAHDVLPDDPDIPQFLSTLGGIAHDLDVAIERIEPRAEAVHDFYADIGLHLQVRGTFLQIATMIEHIGDLPRIVTVQDVSFVEPKAKHEHVLVTSQFDVRMYRFLSDAQLAKQAAKGGKT